MSIRNQIREALDSADRPLWGCEIIAATGCNGRHISGMVNDGALVAMDTVPLSYVVGIRPRPVQTPEERIAKRRAHDRERDRIRRPRSQAEQPRARRPMAVVVPIRKDGSLPTSDDFIRAGGKIQVLPTQWQVGYAQRRPVIRPTARAAG